MSAASDLPVSRPAVASPVSDGIQLLSFFLGGEEYAVDILRVQEIRVWERPTRLPSVPAFVKGVLNLRGEIVPVVDLRERFGLPVSPYGKQTVVVVLQVEEAGRRRAMGAVVDGVSDVYTLERGNLLEAPHVGGPIEADCVLGLGTVGEAMLIVLDVDRLFALNRLLDGALVATRPESISPGEMA